MNRATDAGGRCDEVLVAALRAGDRTAEFELDQGWRPRLVNFARGILYDDGLAQDVAQLALWRAFLNLDRYDERCPLEPWIRAIARNCARDVLRQRKAEPLTHGGELLEQASAAALSAEEGPVRSEERAALQLCLDGLGERSRSVIGLFMADLSLQEMGAALHEAKSTVQGWLNAAFDQVRRCMAGKGFA